MPPKKMLSDGAIAKALASFKSKQTEVEATQPDSPKASEAPTIPAELPEPKKRAQPKEKAKPSKKAKAKAKAKANPEADKKENASFLDDKGKPTYTWKDLQQLMSDFELTEEEGRQVLEDICGPQPSAAKTNKPQESEQEQQEPKTKRLRRCNTAGVANAVEAEPLSENPEAAASGKKADPPTKRVRSKASQAQKLPNTYVCLF